MSGAYQPPGDLVLAVNGEVYPTWERAEVIRDLEDISGSFVFDLDDQARIERGFPVLGPTVYRELVAVRPGMPAEVFIDGSLVLRGYVDTVDLEIEEGRLRGSISGRDQAEDLIDCDANPLGPAEYRGLDLLAIATRLCQPFGIVVTSDADLGEPFTVAAIDCSETVMSVLRKLSAARGVLVVSDGVGGLRLTTAGQQRAASPITMPGNVHAQRSAQSMVARFSDYWVKGQVRNNLRAAAAPMSPATVPSGNAAVPPTKGSSASLHEEGAIVTTGHAIDPEVQRYRPRVWIARTQAGASAAAQRYAAGQDDETYETVVASTPTASSAASRDMALRTARRRVRRTPKAPRTDALPWTLEDQASWHMRTMRAHAERLFYVMAGWHAAPDQLWQVNTVAFVEDAYSGIAADRLIAGVRYLQGEDGPRTELRLVDPALYDLRGDPDTRPYAGRRRAVHVHAVDAVGRKDR